MAWQNSSRRRREQHTALGVFHDQLLELLPRMRTWSFALTRNRADAEDLVNDAAVNALAAWMAFEPSSNFSGWMYSILRNQFISNWRQRREAQRLEDVPVGLLTCPAVQANGLLLQAVWRGFARLTPDQRQAMMLVGVQELSYEEAAELAGCPVGTIKSHVSRARRILTVWLHHNVA